MEQKKKPVDLSNIYLVHDSMSLLGAFCGLGLLSSGLTGRMKKARWWLNAQWWPLDLFKLACPALITSVYGIKCVTGHSLSTRMAHPHGGNGILQATKVEAIRLLEA